MQPIHIFFVLSYINPADPGFLQNKIFPILSFYISKNSYDLVMCLIFCQLKLLV
jgi:hypothetical protein